MFDYRGDEIMIRIQIQKNISFLLMLIVWACFFQERIPSDLTKKILKSAGLGKKKLALDSAMTASELREHLFDEYPKLRDAGGFQYLKTSGQHKVFEVIPLAPSGGYSVANIKAIVKQAKVYLRPIQAELDLSAVVSSNSRFVNNIHFFTACENN